jgi:hypothetical protein
MGGSRGGSGMCRTGSKSIHHGEGKRRAFRSVLR